MSDEDKMLVLFDYDREDMAGFTVHVKTAKTARSETHEGALVIVDYNADGEICSVDVVLKPEHTSEKP